SPFVWSHTSCAAVAVSAFSRANSGRSRHTRPEPMCSSWRFTRVLIWVFIACLAGGCQSASSIPSSSFAIRTNGLPTPAGSSLLGALAYFGLDAIAAVEKHEMQEAIGNGTWRGRFTPEEILDYAESDVEALTRLLFAMLPGIDLPRALFRGRY